MKRILCSTTALSMALWPLPAVPGWAQSLAADGSVIAADGSVLCLPTAEAACVAEDYVEEAQAIAAAMAETQRLADEAAAAAAIEAQRVADEAAAAEAQRLADEAAAAAAIEAQRVADEAAASDAQRIADEAAAAAAAIEAQRVADEAAAVEAQRLADEAAAAGAIEAQRAADEAATAEAARLAEEAAALEAQRLADEAAAAAAIDAQRVADEAAAAEAQRLADEAAAAETQRLADEAAAAEAQRLADEAAAEAARLATEAASSEEAQAAADAAAAEAQRLADEAAAAAETQRLADEAAAETQRLADEAAAAETQRLADEAAAAETQRLADEAAAAAATTTAEPTAETVVPVPEATVLIDPAATPDVATEAVESLGTLLAAPAVSDGAAAAAEVVAAPVAEAAAIPLAPDAAPAADAAAPVVLEQVLTEADTRSSAEEFVTLAPVEPGRRRSGLTDLEKVGLVALGAIVVGAILSNGNEVVDNSGDRVVVRSTSGQYYVYKDDDALLRQPGSNVRTETYGDGSTRTIVDRGDGTQIVTIRDATGRVLRRATYDSQGREIVLIDDLVEEVRVDVTTLPTPTRSRITISTSEGDAELKAALARVQAEELGRSFSLRQIREIPEVRALAATIEVNAITFDSGSAAIKASEAEKLADLGGIINDLVALNPGEIFLIEGHTDAVGSASSNLTLSDRRAESVALALTEYFDVPPENIVVQGYGEGELLIPTTGDERANRRVAVKVITPLMRTAALR